MEDFKYSPKIVDKSEVDKHISIEVLKDPATFVQMSTERFAHMDKDKSGGLSRVELFDSQAHSQSPIEREVSRILLKNYDSAVNLATRKKPATIGGEQHTSGARTAWAAAFGDDGFNKTEISPYDLQVVDHLMLPGSLQDVLKSVRSTEIEEGAVGAFVAPLLAATTFVALDVPPVALAFGAITVGVVERAINNFANSNKVAFDREVDNKYFSLHSWHYFNENGSRAVLDRALADDARS